MNPHLSDSIYKQVGEEIAAKQFLPGAMARAVAEANGNKAVAESLYAKFRFEELAREMERDEISQEKSRQQTIADDLKNGIYTCPKCGCRGELVKKPRGSLLEGVVIFILNIVLAVLFAKLLDFNPTRLKLLLCMAPFFLYILIYRGHKGVCSKCDSTLEPRIQ